MKRLIVLCLISFSNITFACRLGYGSPWRLTEAQLAQASDWISIVEIKSIEHPNFKISYTYSTIKNLKGINPNTAEGKLGPFPEIDEKSPESGVTWQDMSCIQHVVLEVGKKYILFSNSNNLKGVQTDTAENESRIQSHLK